MRRESVYFNKQAGNLVWALAPLRFLPIVHVVIWSAVVYNCKIKCVDSADEGIILLQRVALECPEFVEGRSLYKTRHHVQLHARCLPQVQCLLLLVPCDGGAPICALILGCQTRSSCFLKQ